MQSSSGKFKCLKKFHALGLRLYIRRDRHICQLWIRVLDKAFVDIHLTVCRSSIKHQIPKDRKFNAC